MEESPVRIAVLPSDERALKNLKTRRRRIRNDSGGLEGIRKVALTVTRLPKTEVIGIKVDVVRHAQQKLRATERYIRDECISEVPNLAALSHALAIVLRLSLQSVPVEVYLDGNQFDAEALEAEVDSTERWSSWHRRMMGEFANVVVAYPSGGDNLRLLKAKVGSAQERESRGDTTDDSVRDWTEKLDELLA